MMQQMRTSTGYDRRGFLIAGFGLAAAVASAPALAQKQPAPIGSVEDARGEAHAELNGVRRELKRQGDIFVGDMLATGNNGRLVLKLGPATTIKLGALSRLRIDRYLAETGGAFEIMAGHLQ